MSRLIRPSSVHMVPFSVEDAKGPHTGSRRSTSRSTMIGVPLIENKLGGLLLLDSFYVYPAVVISVLSGATD